MSDIKVKNVGAIINNPHASVTITNNYHNDQQADKKEVDAGVKKLFESLKERYQNRYQSKLDGRFEITLEVDKGPFSVNYQSGKNVSEAFQAISEFPILLLTSAIAGVLSQGAEKFGFATQDVFHFNLLNLFNKNVLRNTIASYFTFVVFFIICIPLVAFAVITGNFLIKFLEQIDYKHSIEFLKNSTLDPYNFQHLSFYVFWFLLLGLLFSVINSNLKVTQFVSLKTPYQRLKSGIFLSIFEWVVFTEIMMLSMAFYEIRYEIYSDNSLTESEHLVLFISTVLILIVSLIRGFFSGIFFTPLFSHIVLRIWLWFEGSVPLKYATFLDYAAKARILEKDGGQWRFRHQNLQEYFAESSY
jgi:hypothetical protein